MALTESLSGVRGVWGKDINEKIAARYTHSYISFLKSKAKTPVIVIGRDTRQSGSLIMDAITEVLNCSIIDVGIAPTPAVELAVREFGADGGIIITASHNEPYFNGFKFLRNDGAVLSENDMAEVIKIFHKNKKINIQKFKKSIIEKNNELMKKYNDFILDFIGKENIAKIKKSKIKIVVDPNGGAGIIAINILRNIGADVIGVNIERGVFSRAIEPNEESLFYLTNPIKENNADFAVGFDCDADRAEIMLPNGAIVSGHYILALAAKYIFSSGDKNYLNNKDIKKNNKKIVVINDATSNVVKEVVEKYNGKIIETGVGEINVVDEMLETNAVLGGEGSSAGAIMPPSRCRDGILTAACIISLVANEGKKLSQIIDSIPKYYTLKEKKQFEPKEYNKIIQGIEIYYSNKHYKIKSLNDSIKIAIDKISFVWFRASKTESGVFRILADSNDREKSEELMKEAIGVFENAEKSK